MKIDSTYDVETMLKMFITSSAIQLSLQLGLFHDLDATPLTSEQISQKYDILPHRTQAWLELLEELDLLNFKENAYSPSDIAKKTILNTYSRTYWSLISHEAHNRYLVGNDLIDHIKHPVSVLKDQNIQFPDWFKKINTDAIYARNFTIALYERHLEFAKAFATYYKIAGAQKILDLGGGSGVISLSLLQKNPNLKAVVIDVENVCIVGREIADKTQVANRIEYVSQDFISEPLPKGFDIILMCDSVGIPTSEFSKKLQNSLNNGGRVVFVHNLDEESSWFYHDRMKIGFQKINNNFLNALCSPSFKKRSVQEVVATLEDQGFNNVNYEIMDNGGLIITGYI